MPQIWSLPEPPASFLQEMVGARRFELPTYGTQNRRATRLRYAPTDGFLKRIAKSVKRFSDEIRDMTTLSALPRLKSRYLAAQVQTARLWSMTADFISAPATKPSLLARPPLISSTYKTFSPPSIGVSSFGTASA